MNRRRFLGLAAGAATLAFGGTRVLAQPGPPPIPTATPSVTPQPHRVSIPGLAADGALVHLQVSIGRVYQGGTFRLSVPGATSATATFLGREYELIPSSDGPIAYIGIGTGAPVGPTPLIVNAIDPVAGPLQLSRSIEILQTNWTVEYIWLPTPDPNAEPGPPTDPRLIEQENELLETTYALVTPRQWIEPWAEPLSGRISSYFGERRSFNGGPVTGHHSGTDYAVNWGTPIAAVNHGTVVVAQNVPIRGNLVIVDHGAGILSGYAHLSSFAVTEGQPVTQGDILGQVGSTGLSTGPHLHWEMSVHGVLVDGLRWLDYTQGF